MGCTWTLSSIITLISQNNTWNLKCYINKTILKMQTIEHTLQGRRKAAHVTSEVCLQQYKITRKHPQTTFLVTNLYSESSEFWETFFGH